MNQIKTGIVLSYVSLAANNLIAILYTPILLRYLGKSEFGLYSLVTSIIAYLTVFDLGIGNTIVRYSALYKSQSKEEKLYSLFGLFIKTYLFISFIVLGIGVMIYFNLDLFLESSLTPLELHRAKIMFILLIANLFLTFPLSVFSSIVTAYQRFIFSKSLNIIRIVMQPLIMIPLLLLGYKAIALVIVVSLLNIGTLIVNAIYAFRILKIKVLFGKVEKEIVREVFIFSFFIFLGIAVDRMNWTTGQIVLGIYAGTETVAIYAVAIQILLCFFGFASSMSGIFLPRITEIITHENFEREISDLFIKIGRLQYIILVLVLVGFIFYGSYFIKYWAGEGYADAYYLSLIIMIPLMLTSIQHTGVLILQALNKQRFRSEVYFVIAILNIILSCILAKHYGAWGCAISFALCMFIGNILIMNFYFAKKIHIDIASFWKEISKSIPALICTVICASVLLYFFPITSITRLLLHILSMIIIFLIFSFLLYMNSYEKGLLTAVIIKMKK